MKAIRACRPPKRGSGHIAASGKMVDDGAWEHPFAGAGKPIAPVPNGPRRREGRSCR